MPRFIYKAIAIWLVLCAGVKLAGQEFRLITVNFHPAMGLFACANQVLGYLDLYESGAYASLSGFAVDFGTHGLYYAPERGPNWWNYYFEPISLGQQGISQARDFSKREDLKAVLKRRRLSRTRSAFLVEKYVHVRPAIQEKVDHYVRSCFQDSFVIGVHYRGTDKCKEAPRVPYETVFESLENHLPLNQPCKFFVATDEVLFLEKIKEKFPDRVLALDAHRSEGDEGIHFSGRNPYEMGEEAVMDALLLSRCDLLIRTSSNLSLWSTYFNPDIPVILLNQRKEKTLEPE